MPPSRARCHLGRALPERDAPVGAALAQLDNGLFAAEYARQRAGIGERLAGA
jgi:hypothetical protein